MNRFNIWDLIKQRGRERERRKKVQRESTSLESFGAKCRGGSPERSEEVRELVTARVKDDEGEEIFPVKIIL